MSQATCPCSQKLEHKERVLKVNSGALGNDAILMQAERQGAAYTSCAVFSVDIGDNGRMLILSLNQRLLQISRAHLNFSQSKPVFPGSQALTADFEPLCRELVGVTFAEVPGTHHFDASCASFGREREHHPSLSCSGFLQEMVRHLLIGSFVYRYPAQ